MPDNRVLEILRTTTLFARFTEEQLEVVPKVGRKRGYAPGEVIIGEGAVDASSMWLILEGRVEVRASGEPIATLGSGDHFGELALLTGAPRAADVVAAEEVEALEFSRSHLQGLIHSDPEVAMAILAELSTRLRRLTEKVVAIIDASPEAAAAAREVGISARAESAPSRLGSIEHALVVSEER
jgi:CRP/FNR family transcriptional regulator/CRP/FNR family cyclic AMP-dependent transcriptional regulator